MNIRTSITELRDLAAAWIALSIAFTFFLAGPGIAQRGPAVFLEVFSLSFLTVGVAFLLHELAHKVVAIHFGKRAEFRADYGMLFVAIAAGLARFLFAAPGAVYHAGQATVRENGLIALAGPVTNLALALVFAPFALLFDGFLFAIGSLGVTINLLLAGFNMLPYGPLDGKTVLNWNRTVFVVVFVPSAALAIGALLGLLPISTGL